MKSRATAVGLLFLTQSLGLAGPCLCDVPDIHPATDAPIHGVAGGGQVKAASGAHACCHGGDAGGAEDDPSDGAGRAERCSACSCGLSVLATGAGGGPAAVVVAQSALPGLIPTAPRTPHMATRLQPWAWPLAQPPPSRPPSQASLQTWRC